MDLFALPDDLVIHVLNFVPADTLLLARGVSAKWRKALASPALGPRFHRFSLSGVAQAHRHVRLAAAFGEHALRCAGGLRSLEFTDVVVYTDHCLYKKDRAGELWSLVDLVEAHGATLESVCLHGLCVDSSSQRMPFELDGTIALDMLNKAPNAVFAMDCKMFAPEGAMLLENPKFQPRLAELFYDPFDEDCLVSCLRDGYDRRVHPVHPQLHRRLVDQEWSDEEAPEEESVDEESSDEEEEDGGGAVGMLTWLALSKKPSLREVLIRDADETDDNEHGLKAPFDHKAIQLFADNAAQLTSFGLYDCAISCTELDALAAVLDNGVTKLDISCGRYAEDMGTDHLFAGAPRASVERFTKALERSKLQKLTLCGTDIFTCHSGANPWDAGVSVLRALAGHPTLEFLDLSNNNATGDGELVITAAIGALLAHPHSRVEHLDLTNCGLCNTNAVRIIRKIRLNVRTLCLHSGLVAQEPMSYNAQHSVRKSLVALRLNGGRLTTLFADFVREEGRSKPGTNWRWQLAGAMPPAMPP